ncbi:MAG TPA: hypothetical protein VHJ54_00995 [Solirubrobacterales bacterium]|jgi:hypothetical protein|nr:hypothetical protein [Solirubrobacterales bacterium]
MSASDACPLCGQALYPWIALPDEPGPARTLDRCDNCGAAAERGVAVDLNAELEAITVASPDGERSVETPNRASLQAGIGGEGWAAADIAPGRLIHTPRSLELLAKRSGHRVGATGFAILGPNQVWMWQTLLNGLTLHPNFAREARAGRLRPSTGRGRPAFAVDLVATVLAAPLVALVSVPLELVGVALRRGGLIRARLTRLPGARSA